MTRLLVSVRSAAEAEAALRGGASVIDVKEPAHGSLGRASDDILTEVVCAVAGARPVSAALGEFAETFGSALPSCLTSLNYLKWGLSRYGTAEDELWHEELWQCELELVLHHLAEKQTKARMVAVAYADWQRARSPLPETCSFAVTHPVGAFLIDTWKKDGSTLLDWLSRREIEGFAERCRVAGVPLALAGSLGPAEMRALWPLRPDWFAVRGAVCVGGRRGGMIEEDRVRRLAALVFEENG